MFEAVAFDLDGTLTKEPSSWVKLHKTFKSDPEVITRNMKLYEESRISCQEWMKMDILAWKQKLSRLPTKKEIEKILLNYELQEKTEEAIQKLKEENFFLCIISSGLKIIVEDIASKLGFDRYLANELFFDEEGNLKCEGKCVVDPKRKGEILEAVAEEEGFPLKNFVAVGDSKYDALMFEKAGLGIAYKPIDEIVKEKADLVIEGTLLEVAEKIISLNKQSNQ